TNRPMQRINHPDVIYRSEREKWNAVIDEIRDVHKSGRPVLVGTVSIEKSELLSNKLSKYGIEHKTLNAKFHEREAEFVAQAGRTGAVTIATNMAGRGTDIILGGNPEHMAWEELKLKKGYESRLEVPKAEWEAASREVAEREGMKSEGRKVAELGGLHVIGTERHDARRIDLQLRGRSGRQGDPGSSRFFLSLDDDLMRIFAGDWVRTILTRLGMEEGEAIESGMVSKQIEKAQKRVEERHFESRKNLLEYDEVMDFQRKEVYAYRQRILDGANCRELILDMIDRQVDRQTAHFLSERYRWETCATWASQVMGVDVEWDQLRDMKLDQMVVYLTDEAHRQAEDQIQEQLDENLPEDVDERDRNWQALAQWANRHFGINTNDRELKKLGVEGAEDGELDRGALYSYLNSRAQEAIARVDFTDLGTILEENFNRRTLCGWLKHQYNLDLDPEEIAGFEDLNRTKLWVGEKLRQQYREQEIKFPVAVGMTRFLGGGGQSDREGLIRWANGRFQSSLTPDDFKEKERPEIETLLTERSRLFFPPAEAVLKLEDQFAPHENTSRSKNGHPRENGSTDLRSLVDFANKEFHVDIKPDALAELGSEEAYREVLQRYDARYRPELGHAERAVLLDVLDHAWKEHLYYMDHLRQGIGLVGYAQKDPKVEYKREGMKAFEAMWDRIGEQVTGAIFRLEKESPQFVGSLWQITGTIHEEAAPASEAYAGDAQPQGQRSGGEVQTVDPIRNREVKVGRNDLCPCGSGKKYKKCHGANG
ncbi:MAG: SEC-C domain-containing protein, partial [Planctomycetaceae bacterium]|nr:SEC-C domain-containing protein [Planctomycetaceae bacterium]